MKELNLTLEGLNCASCAGKIEDLSKKIDGVNDSRIDFISKKLKVKIDDENSYEDIKSEITKIVNKLEPDVVVVEGVKKPKRTAIANGTNALNLKLEGLDCASCAGKIEDLSKKIGGVKEARIDFISKKFKIQLDDGANGDGILSEITSIVNKLEPDVVIINESKKMTVKRTAKKDDYLDLTLEGLDCAGCAGKIEDLAGKIEGVESASVDFVSKKMKVKLRAEGDSSQVLTKIESIIKKLEPDVVVINNRKAPSKKISACSDGCCSDHDDHSHSHGDGCCSGHDDHGHDHGHGDDCGCGHDHGSATISKAQAKTKAKEGKKSGFLDKFGNKKQLFEIIVAAVLFFLPSLLKLEGNARFVVYLLSYIVIGYKIIIIAFRNIMAGQAFDEHFLMTVATLGAFVIGEYPEAVMVMLLYQVGEMFQGMAVNHSRKSISSLLDIRPDYANLEMDGDIIQVDPEEISIGDIIVVRPGEKVPLDGVIVEGKTSLDTSNITGESVPRTVKTGENILSGSVNKEGLIRVRVTKEFGESTVYKILDLVENASSKKAPTESFITKFSKYYTPVVVIIALGIAFLPPLVKGYAFADWIYRACVFLVISCPCALVISVPLGFFGGIGGASKAGVLIKGGNYLEALNDVDTIVFDKTGTITKGTFTVTEVESFEGYKKDEILEMAAYGEYYSNHPIGKSIVEYFGKNILTDYIDDYKEIAGKGIDVKINNEKVLLGNESLLKSNNIKFKPIKSIGTVVYVAKDKKHVGTIVVSDELKENIIKDIKGLKEVGIKNTIMLSGDNIEIAEKVGKEVGMDKVYGDLLPQDKVGIFEKIISERDGNKKVAFVGDGVNDAPVLARADVGIAMGGVGSDAAIEASDIVIMTDEIGKIKTGIKIAKNTKKIVTQNIVLALGVKLVVLSLGAFGVASMWEAVFADVGVSIIAIFNSMRALKVED